MQLSASAALRFCLSSTDAVMLTVWPSGTGQLEYVEHWLSAAQAKVLYSAPIDLTSEAAELLTVLALYDGEEWLESNCWYSEQPLPTGPPSGPFAGAKWKRACAAHACLNQTITDSIPTPTSFCFLTTIPVRCPGFATATRRIGGRTHLCAT